MENYLLPKDIGRYHLANGIDPKCWKCGTFSWSVTNLTVPAESIDFDPEEAAEKAVKVTSLVCKKCATVLFIATRTVAEWLESKKNDDTKDEPDDNA